MKQLLKKAKAITLLILMLSLIGCENDDDNFPKVIAGFTYTLNADSGTVSFINTSENAGSYTWDFGDGSTSDEINPIKTYANGTYRVILKASNASGASASFEDTIIISIPNPIALPVTFDDPNVAYDVAAFEGASFEILDNPDVSGTNDKATKVGAITNSGAEFEGITFDLGTQVDLTANKTITMNFWADTPVDVLMKLEQGTGDDIEVTASHGGTGWEVISFDFNSSNKYVRLTLFVDGPLTTEGTFYIDDIKQIETPPATCTPETAQSLDAADFNLTFQTDPTGSIIDDGAVLISAVNPDPDNAVNSSCQVGKVIRDPSLQYANNQIEFDAKLDFNANAGFKMKVWSPEAGTNILVKLEDKTNSGVNVEVGAISTSAGAWEELNFDFSSDESGKYDKIVLFFNIDSFTAGEFYIDDFRLYEGTGGSVTCTPETSQSLDAADLNLTFLTDPSADIIEDGGDFEWVSNPDFDNAVNSSCYVGKITKLGNNPWDNNQINLDAKLDFNANAGLKIKVWSDVAGFKVRIKLEDQADAGTNTELEVTSTKTSQWEELTFPFASSESGKYDKIVLFFDLNANNTDTYYFDDLKLYEGAGGGQVCTPENSQSLAASDFNLTFQTDPGAGIGSFNAVLTTVANPDFENAVNTSCQVGQIDRDGGDLFANNQIEFDAKLDFNANAGFKMKVWSPEAGTNVLLKLEDKTNSGINVEVGAITTSAGAWEELTFDFASIEDGKYDRIIVFFELNTNTTQTYYIDDFRLYERTGGGGDPCTPPSGDLVSNGDFETGTDACWSVFQNGGIAVLDNTINNGGSWSGKLVTNGPSNPAFKQERIGTGTVMAGDVVQITFDHIGSVVQPGAVFNVLLFGEGAAGASFTHVFSPAPALTESWTTFTGTFTIPAAADVTEGISFLIEAVCGGDAGCNVTANIDNVSVKLNP